MVNRTTFPTRFSGDVELRTGYSSDNCRLSPACNTKFYASFDHITVNGDDDDEYNYVFLRLGDELVTSVRLPSHLIRRFEVEMNRQ